MSELVAQLRALESLAACNDDELGELAQHATAVNVPANWAFIIEGMPGDTCYLVLDGEVSVRRTGDEIRRVGPGVLVGELAIIDDKPRSASCVALTPLRLLQIDAYEFNGWLQQHREIRDGLLAAAIPRHKLS